MKGQERCLVRKHARREGETSGNTQKKDRLTACRTLLGAQGETRTRTDYSTRPSNVRGYQLRHLSLPILDFRFQIWDCRNLAILLTDKKCKELLIRVGRCLAICGRSGVRICRRYGISVRWSHTRICRSSRFNRRLAHALQDRNISLQGRHRDHQGREHESAACDDRHS